MTLPSFFESCFSSVHVFHVAAPVVWESFSFSNESNGQPVQPEGLPCEAPGDLDWHCSFSSSESVQTRKRVRNVQHTDIVCSGAISGHVPFDVWAKGATSRVTRLDLQVGVGWLPLHASRFTHALSEDGLPLDVEERQRALPGWVDPHRHGQRLPLQVLDAVRGLAGDATLHVAGAETCFEGQPAGWRGPSTLPRLLRNWSRGGWTNRRRRQRRCWASPTAWSPTWATRRPSSRSLPSTMRTWPRSRGACRVGRLVGPDTEDFPTMRCVRNLMGHSHAVRCLALSSTSLFSGRHRQVHQGVAFREEDGWDIWEVSWLAERDSEAGCLESRTVHYSDGLTRCPVSTENEAIRRHAVPSQPKRTDHGHQGPLRCLLRTPVLHLNLQGANMSVRDPRLCEGMSHSPHRSFHFLCRSTEVLFECDNLGGLTCLFFWCRVLAHGTVDFHVPSTCIPHQAARGSRVALYFISFLPDSHARQSDRLDHWRPWAATPSPDRAVWTETVCAPSHGWCSLRLRCRWCLHSWRSSHSVATFLQVGPLPFVVLQVLLWKSSPLHASTVPLVLNNFSCTCSAYFSKLTCDWVFPKHELTSHGFSVSHNTVMGKCIGEQISAVVAVDLSTFCAHVLCFFSECDNLGGLMCLLRWWQVKHRWISDAHQRAIDDNELLSLCRFPRVLRRATLETQVESFRGHLWWAGKHTRMWMSQWIRQHAGCWQDSGAPQPRVFFGHIYST